MRISILWLMVILFCSSFANAKEPNPVMTARGLVWDDDADDEILQNLPAHTLKFKKLDVRVNIVGGFAQTRIEAVVYNPGDIDDLEGDFRLQMPSGSIVNGYALDVEGMLIDGVIIAKERGEKAYTDKVTENIDPGLAEIIGADTYRTRVYPIQSKKSRTFAVEFATPLLSGHYELPFGGTGRIGDMTITIEGDARSVERATLPSGHWIRTSESKNKYAVRAKNVHPNGALSIPASPVKPVITEHSNGQKFVSFTLERDEMRYRRQIQRSIKRARIYWDNSYSRQLENNAQNLEKEIAMVKSFLTHTMQHTNVFETEIIIGNASKKEVVSKKIQQEEASYALVDEMGEKLENIVYEGATDLNHLLGGRPGTADICIVFTDGYGTVGQAGIPKLDCPVFVLSARKDVNTGYLRLLAENNNGQLLTGRDFDFFIDPIIKMPKRPQLVGGNLSEMRAIPTKGYKWGKTKFMVIAPLPHVIPATIDAVFVDGTGQSYTVSRPLVDLAVQPHNGPATLWAQRIAEEIRAEGEAGYLPLIAHASKYNLPGSETSLIVLEEPDDYVEADIEPPASYPVEGMAEFIESQADKRVEKLEEASDRLEEVIDIWEEQKEWWATDFSKQARNKSEKRSLNGGAPVPTPPAVVAQESADGYVAQDFAGVGSPNREGDDLVIVTGSRIKSPQTKITTKAWSPDRPYIVALKAVDAAELGAAYLEQREIYGQSPAFFLDVGDFYHQRGDDERAAQTVLSALELEMSGSITRTAVANRLLDYGYTEQAVYLLRIVALRESFRPQPFYDLAVALTAHGDVAKNKDIRNIAYLEALQNFDMVIRNTWNGDYDGVELVALMDANALIAKLPNNLKHRIPLDERLIDNLDVDLRVIIDWNFDRADMDLWVVEPTTEKASYQNQLTHSGGQLSNDMTSGYGPEQYLIHNAPKGIYKVIANYYGSNAYNPNGAIAVRARLYKDFGRKNQTMQNVTIEFVKENKAGDDDAQDDSDIDRGHGEYPLAEIEVK